MANKVKFKVDESSVSYTDKSIKLPLRRRYGNRARVGCVCFPLSQVNISESGPYVIVSVPEWLVNKHTGSEYCVDEG